MLVVIENDESSLLTISDIMTTLASHLHLKTWHFFCIDNRDKVFSPAKSTLPNKQNLCLIPQTCHNLITGMFVCFTYYACMRAWIAIYVVVSRPYIHSAYNHNRRGSLSSWYQLFNIFTIDIILLQKFEFQSHYHMQYRS